MIRLYNASDEIGINLLFEAVFRKKRTLSEWQWKFETVGSYSPIIIVAVEDHQIVGHAACLVFDGVDINGQPILIGERVDIMVHPEFQGKGIYKAIVKRLIEACESQNITFLYGFPAELAKKIFLNSAEATDLGNINRYVSLNFPSLGKKNPHQLLKTLPEAELVNMSDKDVSTSIHIKRSPAFLTNRYMKHPSVDYFVHQSNIGYVIYRIDQLKSIIPVYTIVDILADDELSIIKSFKKTVGFGLVSTWGIPNTPFEETLMTAGFKVHSSPMPFVVKTLTNHDSGQTYTNWRILQGDVDSF